MCDLTNTRPDRYRQQTNRSNLLVVVDEVGVRHVYDLLRVELSALGRDHGFVGDHVVNEVRPQGAAETQVGDLLDQEANSQRKLLKNKE